MSYVWVLVISAIILLLVCLVLYWMFVVSLSHSITRGSEECLTQCPFCWGLAVSRVPLKQIACPTCGKLYTVREYN
jgi:hypothetical protein